MDVLAGVLIETLRVYLKYRNAISTAAALHIHRNARTVGGPSLSVLRAAKVIYFSCQHVFLLGGIFKAERCAMARSFFGRQGKVYRHNLFMAIKSNAAERKNSRHLGA